MYVINSATDLISQRQAIADSIRYRHDPPLYLELENERLKLVFDLPMHIAFLGEALRCNLPRIFSEYVVWTNQLLISCGGNSQDFQDCLRAIDEEIQSLGSGDLVEKVQLFIIFALQQMEIQQPVSQSFFNDDNPLKNVSKAFLTACLNLNRNQAFELVQNAVQVGTPVHDIYSLVITPAMHELGRLWHVNQITVGHEHYCTAVAQMVMSQLLPLIFDGSIKTKRLVSACVAGELHEIGARMVADTFEMHGWDTVFLGADVPIDSLVSAIIAHDADVLAISATLACHLTSVSEIINAVKTHAACDRVKIMVGGAAFSADNSIWQILGADGWAQNAEGAVNLANTWHQ